MKLFFVILAAAAATTNVVVEVRAQDSRMSPPTIIPCETFVAGLEQAMQPPIFCELCCWCIPEDDEDEDQCPAIGDRRTTSSFDQTEIDAFKALKVDPESLVGFEGKPNCQPYDDVAKILGVAKCKKPKKTKKEKKPKKEKKSKKGVRRQLVAGSNNSKNGKKTARTTGGGKRAKKTERNGGKGKGGKGKDKDVCAFVFDEATCTARDKYSLETINLKDLDEGDDDIIDRATVTHDGGCGVCSSAQDLAVNLDPGLNVKAFFCSNILANAWDTILAQDLKKSVEQAQLQAVFDTTASCFGTGFGPISVGFTDDCAKLYASNAANSFLAGCTQPCQEYLEPCLALGDPTLIAQCAVFGIPPPNSSPGIYDPSNSCDLNECLTCDEEESGKIFALFAGRTRRSSGLVTVSDDPFPIDPMDLSKGLIGGAFIGLKRPCDTVADIGQDLCGTLDGLLSVE